ncbi:MAG: hypothetical protein CSH37_04755 [Thalassolituus sp.]|jgi:hypothetical protein|nr:MAG: hypothetical protein CSH37_04755 [Thalassolituus sp.]|tara:strand:+ start:292 stop:621 length:330 start_codon:yes stop_codon:yes gene_type:complete
MFFFIRLSFILFVASPAALGSVEQFNYACQIYGDAMRIIDSMENREEYVRQRLQEQFPGGESLAVHEAIWTVAPNERYEVYVASVSDTYSTDWSCDYLREFFNQSITQQ